MLTLTSQEFDDIKYFIREAYRGAVREFTSSALIGGNPDINKMEEISLYLDALETWEQDDLIYLSHPNYLTPDGVRAIYNRVRYLQG